MPCCSSHIKHRYKLYCHISGKRKAWFLLDETCILLLLHDIGSCIPCILACVIHCMCCAIACVFNNRFQKLYAWHMQGRCITYNTHYTGTFVHEITSWPPSWIVIKQKSDCINRHVFIWRTLLPNFTPIWFEMRALSFYINLAAVCICYGALGFFEEVTSTRTTTTTTTWVLSSDSGSVPDPKNIFRTNCNKHRRMASNCGPMHLWDGMDDWS